MKMGYFQVVRGPYVMGPVGAIWFLLQNYMSAGHEAERGTTDDNHICMLRRSDYSPVALFDLQGYSLTRQNGLKIKFVTNSNELHKF
jgi:hypothetical protein